MKDHKEFMPIKGVADAEERLKGLAVLAADVPLKSGDTSLSEFLETYKNDIIGVIMMKGKMIIMMPDMQTVDFTLEMRKPYCTQNNGDCSTCSLVNYNRDCYNVPIRGGKRNGAGRPATGRKKKNVYVTDSEFAEIKKLIEQIRASE